MSHEHAAELTHIGDALAPVRAAIDVVARGAASRVTVHAPASERILPAARALGRAAGVTIEPLWWPDHDGFDIDARRSDA